MKKPSYLTTENMAIVGIAAGVVIYTIGHSRIQVAETNLKLLMSNQIIAKMNELNPEVVMTAAQAVEKEMQTALDLY